MSKIQIFIDNFETLTLAKLNFYTGKVAEYKTARASAIAITYGKICSWPYKKEPDSDGVYRRDPAVSTVGDLFKYIYPDPEGGKRVFPGGNDPTSLGDVFAELKDQDTGAKPLEDILSKTYGASNQVKFINNLRKYGAQKWFDSFMSSTLKFLKDEKKSTSDYKTSDEFSYDYSDFISEFKYNYGDIADVSTSWITTDDILYDAFIEAGDNYQLPPGVVAATQSGTQSATQSSVPNVEYKISVKDPKSDNDKKIEGTLKFSEQGKDRIAISVLNNLPNPWKNPKTNKDVDKNGTISYNGRPLNNTGNLSDTIIADDAIRNLQNLIDYHWGIELRLQYTPSDTSLVSGPESGTQSGTQSSAPLSSTQSGLTQSTFDATGIKIKLQKKSGPGELIGEVEQTVKDGFVNFVGIQFDTPGDYVISVIPDSNLIETSEVTIKVLPEDDVIAQDKSRGGEQEPKDVQGTRPIIAQIDKPTIKLKPIEFEALQNNRDNAEVAGALGFTPFFWYSGVQIDQRYINSLNLYYDGLVPMVSIVFVDSMGVMKKDGFPLDDSKFEIFLNSGSKNLKSIHLKFKLNNFQENKSKTYTIVGTLDLQDFYKIRFQSYKGTSFETLQKMCKELGIGFNSNITNTSDSMTWVNNGKLFRTFITDIISHSYISDKTFLIGYIDFYYCFNYVDIEKEWIRDISKDVGINSRGLNHLNTKEESEKVVQLQLSNDLSQNSSSFFFNRYRVNNNSTQTSLNSGQFTVSKVYDSIKKQFLVFDVDSQTSDGSKSIILKGAPSDDQKDNYRTRYSGKMDTENVHKQYYYSETQNKVNFDNMARISVDLELPNANFNLYKFMKIQLNFVNMKTSVNNDEISQKRLTGEWVIIDISYTWTQGNLTQKVTAVRKELSKTDEELKKDANSTPTKAETNTQNNENPVVPGQTQPILSTAVPPNSVYKVGQIFLVQNNSGKAFKLTITEVSENGKEVKATIKNI